MRQTSNHVEKQAKDSKKNSLQPSAFNGRTSGSPVAQLQKMVGNRAVIQMMRSQTAGLTAPIQRKGNNTGMPDHLKQGVEQLSGMSLDNVKVHYNSDKPASVQALAYAQGSDIHLGPGQEQHLPHEAWHVVQQRQGRVQPTMQMKSGVSINDDKALEKEADTMGAKANTYSGLQQ